jgi:hypothetical protein
MPNQTKPKRIRKGATPRRITPAARRSAGGEASDRSRDGKTTGGRRRLPFLRGRASEPGTFRRRTNAARTWRRGFRGREKSRGRGNGVSFRSLARSSVFYFLMIFFRERRGVTAFATVHVAGGSRVRVGPRWARAQRGLVSVRPTSAWPKITLP